MKPHDFISNESREKLEQIAAKTGVGILLLHITGIESLCFSIPSFQGVQEFDTGAHRMEDLLSLMQRLGNPETQEDFLNVAHQLNNTGIKARSQGKYYSAFLCYRFALAVAIYFRDWFGVKSLTGNIWMIAESIKDLLRVNVMSPSPDNSGLAKLTQSVYLAGNSMIVSQKGESVEPEDEYLMLTASFIEEDAEELLPVVNNFADTISQGSNEQKLYVLQVQHRLAAMANKIEIRRSTLTELYSLAMEHEKYEIALNTVIEELAQVTEFDLLIDSDSTVRGYRGEGDKIVQFTEPDHGFSAVWDLYLKSRQHIDERWGKELLHRYAYVFRQMQSLRWHATCAGGTNGHRLSYNISKFLHPIGRDYIYLLKRAGNIDTALTVAEQIHSRSMVDWMARTHHTNRLVRHKRLRGSMNAIMPASLTEIRRASVENNAPLLFYLETHDGYEVWLQCTDGSLVNSHIQPPKNMINRILKNLSSVTYEQALESPKAKGRQRHHGTPLKFKSSLNKLNSDLSQLYLALFPPKVRESLSKAESEKLVIITDSLLEYVPFCALRTEDGKYLIEKFGLTYWPSVTAWLLTKTSARVKSSVPELLRSQYRQDRFDFKPTELPPLPEIPSAVVFGNPDFTWTSSAQNSKQVQQLKLNPLGGTEEEAQQIGKILSVDPQLTTNASSHELFDRANVVPIIHLATHGILDTENPEDSFIALADGKLSANFLYQSDRPICANLVTLSACQTALGGEHPDSLIGLSNAFLIAGANAVVSTLWSIDDLRTVPLIVEFYRKILDGENIAEALRNAQTEFLHKPKLQHPYYWAAFKLIGNSSNPLLETT